MPYLFSCCWAEHPFPSVLQGTSEMSHPMGSFLGRPTGGDLWAFALPCALHLDSPHCLESSLLKFPSFSPMDLLQLRNWELTPQAVGPPGLFANPSPTPDLLRDPRRVIYPPRALAASSVTPCTGASAANNGYWLRIRVKLIFVKNIEPCLQCSKCCECSI